MRVDERVIATMEEFADVAPAHNPPYIAAMKAFSQKLPKTPQVAAFGAPPIEGLGTTGGFKIIIEDRGNLGLAELQRASDQVVIDVAQGKVTASWPTCFWERPPVRCNTA